MHSSDKPDRIIRRFAKSKCNRQGRRISAYSKGVSHCQGENGNEVTNGGSVETMNLNDNSIRSFRVAKVFRENSDRINHIDFSSNGETIIASSDDDSIVIYDCLDGK